MREITVATVQMKPELGNSENNLVKMSDFISTIVSQQKVDLIVFPELITSGYELGVKFTELAQRVPGPAINLMAQRAADAGVYIAFGLATKERVESIIYNSAVLVGPEGELLGQYNKIHLKGEERMAFREGFKMPVIDTGEIGKIGLLIGWDLAFPEVARSLTLEGAEVLCVLANWETSNIEEWKAYLASRAYENALFVAGANRVGEDVTMNFGGESLIMGPRGKIYARLDSAPKSEPKKDKDKEDRLHEAKDSKDVKETRKDGETAAADLKDKESKAAIEPKDIKDSEGVKDTPKGADARKVVAVKPDLIKQIATAEGYCVARIDLDEVRRFREEFQTLQSRQPTAYRNLVKRY